MYTKMDTGFLEIQSLELKTAAKDFQRLVNQQISLFTKEKENHQKVVEELNRSYIHINLAY